MKDITKNVVISIVGRANTGKSTLINRLVGEKIAITSPKPQTTRTRITGVFEKDECQYVFLDTPGLHLPKSRLGECMVKIVRETVSEVDAALLVVEPLAAVHPAESELISKIKELGIPSVLAINKIDTIKKDKLLEIIGMYAKLHDFDAIIPICAKSGEGTDDLISELYKFASEGGRLFPDGMTTDQPETHLVAEIVREKLLYNLSDEVPHGIAVETARLSENDKGIVEIDVTIYCEKTSHKGIIIGKNGEMLKKIGSAARTELEKFYGTKVFLQTWVKVKDNWRDSANFIRNMGLDG